MSMIVRHITYLLRNHDCVVVPGIGAFIAQRISARIDAEQNTVYPPSRMLGFNAEIGHDDGLLASSVARQMKVTYQQAQKILTTEVDALRCHLINTGEINIPRIGTLHREADNRITFEPAANNNVVSTTYLGLHTISLSPLNPNLQQEVLPTTAETCPTIYRRWLKIAASVALILCMGGLLSTPVDLTDTQLASLGITVTEPQEITEEDTMVDFEINQPSSSATLNIAIPDETLTTENMHRTISSQINSEDNGNEYYLIVASLPSEKLARKFIAEDGNKELKILNKDGRYRVYVATGSTEAETMSMLYINDRSARYPDAWVCGK